MFTNWNISFFSITRESTTICPVAMFVVGLRYHGRSNQLQRIALEMTPRAMENWMNRGRNSTTSVMARFVKTVPLSEQAIAAAAKTSMAATI